MIEGKRGGYQKEPVKGQPMLNDGGFYRAALAEGPFGHNPLRSPVRTRRMKLQMRTTSPCGPRP